jgi:hypothetical protein
MAQTSKRNIQGPGRAAALVPVDQEPLRACAAEDCSQMQARLERARIGWHRFERQDKPAFVRWRAREFGSLLSRAREVEDRIRDLQNLVHEVEMEMRRGFCDPFRAYELVIARRNNPGATPEPAPEEPAGGGSRGQRLTDFEKEALFQDWVRAALGTHPDKMDDAAYAKSFEAFKSHMFQTEPRPSLPNDRERGRTSPRFQEEKEEENEERAPVDLRVKELYRRLVRRLHPDLRADGSAAVSALWHEVQEAYAANDVARMELLLALSDIESRGMAEQSLSQMRALAVELQRSVAALEKSLLEAESEEAWDFARIGPNADLRLRVERQLRFDLARREQRLDLLSRTVQEWAAGPVANRTVFI